ncbi:hypothetical protein GCM10007385_32930 [Tateyamaria omphalii]|nr:hypothetical protein GCM10007385_32930 [Tateyamaria omphalii]
MRTVEKCPLKSREQVAVDLPDIRDINLRGQWPDIEAIQQCPEISQVVRWQSLLDLGEPTVSEACEGERSFGAHASDANYQSENLWDRESGRGLH